MFDFSDFQPIYKLPIGLFNPLEKLIFLVDHTYAANFRKLTTKIYNDEQLTAKFCYDSKIFT